ncbi:MAG: hypothetical protein V1899_10385 [Planctomycetota bacterium]
MKASRLSIILGLWLALVGHGLCASENRSSETDLSCLQKFSDPIAGYSIRIPEGYKRLTEDENREVIHGLSEIFGKEFGERTAQQPPTYFKGPKDSARLKNMPPTLAISYSPLDEPIDASKLSQYQAKIERTYKKHGIQHGDLKLEVIQINNVNALRVEHEVFSPIDNSRGFKTFVTIPGKGRRYEIILDYSPSQIEGAQSALAIVLKSFQLEDVLFMNPETQSKWSRVILWTIGGFVAGVLLSLLLLFLIRTGAKTSVTR